MNTPLRQEKIDSRSKQEENVDFQGIHDKGMHSPRRQKMEWFLLNLSPLSEKVKHIHHNLFACHLKGDHF